MKPPVAVLHVIEAMRTGGAESMVVEHVRCASPDFRVLVCALNAGGPALEAARAAGAGTWVLAKHGRRAQGVLRLARLMAEEGVAVAHGHNPTGALYATAAACWARVPVRVRTEHSVRYPGRHSAVYPLLERAMNRLNHRVLCVCEAVRESHRPVADAARLVVVENGVGEGPGARPRERVREELGEDLRAPVALAVGSLTGQKAHEVLLAALAFARGAAPAARLWIAGDGPRRAELERIAGELGIADIVRFLGRRDDVHDLMAAADVFVLSSRREGLSITLLEAMRCGRAALVTDVGGSAEAVGRGECGRVVPPEDGEALGRALARLLTDAPLRGRLGGAAQARWRERYTARLMVARTEQVYRELLGARALAPADRERMGDGRVVA